MKKRLFLIFMGVLLCFGIKVNALDNDDDAYVLYENIMYSTSGDTTEIFIPDKYDRKSRIYVGNYDNIKDEEFMVYLAMYSYSEEPKMIDSLHKTNLTYDDKRQMYYLEFTTLSYQAIYAIYIKVSDDNADINYYFGLYQDNTVSNSIESVYAEYNYQKENGGATPIFRMYNNVTGEHLYTSDPYEVKVIFSEQGWGYEGVAWYSADTGTPIYRLYNPILGNHLYTTDTHEIEVLTTTEGWTADFDGEPIMYSSGDINVYRLYNQPLDGMHHWTTDQNEYKVLPSQGWVQEGNSFKAVEIGNPKPTDYYYINFD